jgi:hypothetical protein
MTYKLYDLKSRVLITLGKYVFKKPLEVTLFREIDDGYKSYVAENEYLSWIGSGETVEDAMEALEGHIDASVVGFHTFSMDEISEPSKMYIKRWNEYIDLDRMYQVVINGW